MYSFKKVMLISISTLALLMLCTTAMFSKSSQAAVRA